MIHVYQPFGSHEDGLVFGSRRSHRLEVNFRAWNEHVRKVFVAFKHGACNVADLLLQHAFKTCSDESNIRGVCSIVPSVLVPPHATH